MRDAREESRAAFAAEPDYTSRVYRLARDSSRIETAFSRCFHHTVTLRWVFSPRIITHNIYRAPKRRKTIPRIASSTSRVARSNNLWFFTWRFVYDDDDRLNVFHFLSNHNHRRLCSIGRVHFERFQPLPFVTREKRARRAFVETRDRE